MKLLILQNFEPFKTGRIKTVNFKRKNSNDSSFSYVNSFGFLCWIEITIFLYDRFLVGWHFTFVSLGADVNLILGLFFLTIDWFDRIRAHFLVWNGFIKQALSVAFSVCGYTWISDFWTNVPGFAIIFSSMDPIRSSIYRLSRSCFHHLLFNILPLTAFCGDRVFKFLSFSMVDFIRFHRGSIQFSSIRPASSVGNTFFSTHYCFNGSPRGRPFTDVLFRVFMNLPFVDVSRWLRYVAIVFGGWPTGGTRILEMRCGLPNIDLRRSRSLASFFYSPSLLFILLLSVGRPNIVLRRGATRRGAGAR